MLAAASILVPLRAVGGDTDTYEIASQLGRILGSEDFCGLSYDQQAISEFISRNVKADDLHFASNLETSTLAADVESRGMTQSEKTARCVQITRTAKALSFIH